MLNMYAFNALVEGVVSKVKYNPSLIVAEWLIYASVNLILPW